MRVAADGRGLTLAGNAGDFWCVTVRCDRYAFPTDGFDPHLPANTPPPVLVFSDDADAHGAALTRYGRDPWIADRGRNFLWALSTSRDQIVGTIPLARALSDDPTPDRLMMSPDASHAFMSLRGPNPLSGDPDVSTGATPGVGVVTVTRGGRDGRFESLAPVSNRDAGGVERADVHALVVRVLERER